MLINLTNVSYGYDDTLVFYGVNATINEGDRIGLVGINGAGKTTLINVLLKNLECVDGDVFHKSNLRIGYLAQNSGLEGANSVYEEMSEVYRDIDDLISRMQKTACDMALYPHDSHEYRKLSHDYNSLSARIDAVDGYNKDVRIKTVLNGMGFTDNYHQIISTMSGGEKTRLKIAKLLLESPDILILDEPTNHLDFRTLAWLESYLSTYKGALLIVSHDRYFLDKTVSRIWEIEDCTFTTYKGNYTKYRVLKREATTTRMREYIRQSEKMLAMKAFAERNIHRASTSGMAKSRLKQLERIEPISKPRTYQKPPTFSFEYTGDEPEKFSLTISKLDLYGGDKKLLNHADLQLLAHDRVAILGPNGAGKSTLLRTILDRGNPHVKWGKHTTLSYYDQENLNLNFDNTVIDELWGRYHRETQTYIRNILGRVGLTEEDIYKKVSMLSGGERARLGLAIMMADRANTLVLDEPTNHLDLLSMEALERALAKYKGTVIFVSHDRYFINLVATKIVEIEGQTLNIFEGNYDEYLDYKKALAEEQLREQERAKVSAPITKKVAPKSPSHKTKDERRDDAKRRQYIFDLENEISTLETLEKSLLESMSSPEASQDYELLKDLSQQLEDTRHHIDELTLEWERLSE